MRPTESVAETGVCRSPGCENAERGTRLELYPGAGEFCPMCGEPLAPLDPDAAAPEPTPAARETEVGPVAVAVAPPPAPPSPPPAPEPAAAAPPEPPPTRAASSAPAETAAPPEPVTAAGAAGAARMDEAPVFREAPPLRPTPQPAAPPPEPAPFLRMEPAVEQAPPRRSPWLFVGLAAVAVVVAIAIGLGALRPRVGPGGAATTVCDSSMTQRVVADVIGAYAAAKGVERSSFTIARGGTCDVSVVASVLGAREDLIAHDAIVAVVNPQNPLTRLSQAQLRAIASGQITNWSQVHGRRGRIRALIPADGTDEDRALRQTVLRAATIASSAERAPSSADVVRTVASASGRDTIGFVAFSAASPAKVLSLDNAPPPSALSIADHRYPLSINVMVRQDPRAAHDDKTAAFVDYLRSDAAQAVLVRDGLVSKEGF